MCPIRIFSTAGDTNSSAYRRPSGPDILSANRLNCSGKPIFLREQRMGSKRMANIGTVIRCQGRGAMQDIGKALG
jgi:hypothetical protein